MLCKWFVDNKLNQFRLCSQLKIKNSKPLNIQYNDSEIKQYSKVTFLTCILDETLSRESKNITVINNINSLLRFLYRQNRFLNVSLRRLLCNAVTQPFFDYVCNAWYPNVNKNLKLNAFTSCPKKMHKILLK